MRAVTLYRLSGLAVLIGMTIDGIASVLYSRAGGVALYLDPLVPADDLAKLLGSLIFLIGLPGLYAFQAARAGRLGLGLLVRDHALQRSMGVCSRGGCAVKGRWVPTVVIRPAHFLGLRLNLYITLAGGLVHRRPAAPAPGC
jgi:hypothetical protein